MKLRVRQGLRFGVRAKVWGKRFGLGSRAKLRAGLRFRGKVKVKVTVSFRGQCSGLRRSRLGFRLKVKDYA